ncbi:MAG: carboxypeptidase-like regulatory domain-containing protein [Alistipes sp.]|nr:carboxypeptidase-like regulatory domain-containing protein [Alistipes sp.]
MKKLLLTVMLVSGFVLQAFAQQTATVTATIIDSETNLGVPGAVLEMTPLRNPDQKKYTTSDADGKVSASGVPYGKYTLKVTFIGYEPSEREFIVSQPRVNLGVVKMSEGSMKIDAVKIEVQSMRTSQKGDTVSYNASAFKVSDDADVEGLLKKMPGITISNGEVEAQGETVKKVFVDGKEFFGEDVTSAIKSLPAQAVKSIEVYNKLSDQAEFSGMDDGEGYKAINIVTHSNMRQGQFGKLYAGYGYDADTETGDKHKYLAGGNVNIFSGDSRLSVIGLFNNVNQQNFSFEDILGVSGNTGGGRPRGVGQYMVRPQSGVATVNSIGLNFSDTWGRNDNVTFQGSYFFNRTSTKNISTVDKWYEAPYDVDTLSTAGNSKTINSNHRLNARIEWKISPNQSLMSRTGFSYQANDPLSRTFGRQWGES